jgi:hypothetical protein
LIGLYAREYIQPVMLTGDSAIGKIDRAMNLESQGNPFRPQIRAA